ncbi:hypothetical protein AKJ16_DCAP17436 [Drosera capensis]
MGMVSQASRPLLLWKNPGFRAADFNFQKVSKQFLSISNCSRATLNIFDPTIQDLPKYLQRFTNDEKINLSRFHGDLHRALVQIAESGVLLEELDVSGGNFHTVPLKELAGSSLRNSKVLRFESRDG